MAILQEARDVCDAPSTEASFAVVSDVWRKPPLEGVALECVSAIVAPERALGRMAGAAMAEAFDKISSAIPALRRARTCYDHIAGELGVAIADGLVRLQVVDLTVDGAAVTETGRAVLFAADIPLCGGRQGKRVYCRPCLDWSERRPHIAGLLGAALLERAIKTGLVRRRKGCRVLDVADGSETDVLRRLGFGKAAL